MLPWTLLLLIAGAVLQTGIYTLRDDTAIPQREQLFHRDISDRLSTGWFAHAVVNVAVERRALFNGILR